jgi:hypothetical protein
VAISSEQARINGLKGGRPRGSKGKAARDVQAFVDKVFSKVDPQELAEELMLNCKSEKVQGMVFLRLLEYRYGRPISQIEGDLNLNINSQLVDTLRAARNRWKDHQ